MIRIHSSTSSPLNPLFFYAQMISLRILPDHLTFPFLLKHCSVHSNLTTARCLHTHVFELGFDEDLFVQNALVFVYANCGLIDCARLLFDEMRVRDVVSWNSILTGNLRCGKLDEAMSVFSEMKERNVRTWNAIITGFVRGGRAREALCLFYEMQLASDGCVKPDKVTVASVVAACASLGAMDQGRWVHGYLKRHMLEFDVVIGTALIDMYGKCGCVERAVEVFEELSERDVLAWTAMISVFATHGLAEEAFGLFEEMVRQGLRPNHVTFGALLSACAHAGLVEKGRWCLDVMKRVYYIEPQQQHFACIVDLLGRAGLFEEAEHLINSMPVEPDSFVWGALLGACRMHGNVEIGERVASYLIGLDPLNHVLYVILSDIYARANRFADVKKIRSYMKDHGIKKTTPGCSMIEIDGKILEFSAKGMPEDMIDQLEWVLNSIVCELKCTENLFNHRKDVMENTLIGGLAETS
ncbi:pentatricopeptide repeat-containing protein At5g66520-like [Typha latifolia]|uniref:pentatricopeptide repeat-containing protein At5g66520-like n=1 Tax=Typha latifolia TaxID=4733 RepID=UPI003C2B81AD